MSGQTALVRPDSKPPALRQDGQVRADRKDGYMEGGGWLISWCIGCLAELSESAAYDPDYAKWWQEDLTILPESWRFTISVSAVNKSDAVHESLRGKRPTLYLPQPLLPFGGQQG